jgi:hypothetical protein
VVAVLAVAIGLGLVAPDGSAYATVALAAAARLVTLLLGVLWANEHDYLVRTEVRLHRFERRITARFPLDPPPAFAEAARD